IRKADEAWGEAALGHGPADTRCCRMRSAELASRIPSLLGSPPSPAIREPRCTLRSDDTEADWAEVASIDPTEARNATLGISRAKPAQATAQRRSALRLPLRASPATARSEACGTTYTSRGHE